jgi:hypothetical protein
MLADILDIHMMHTPTERRCDMRGRLIASVGIFCMVILIVSGVDAQMKPDEQGKPDKPFKPGKPGKELIIFTGDLSGYQVVEGCCPNAGPFPEYTMCLNFEVGGYPAGTCYDGQLFINGYRYLAKGERQYKVQFWREGTEVAIEIIGGVIDYDKRTKVLTVTFTEELCVDLYSGRPITLVSFTLVRHETD